MTTNSHLPSHANGLTLGFIGAGRLAQTLALALEQQTQHRIRHVASRQLTSAQAMANQLTHCQAEDRLQTVADSCDLVFITTPDDAIADTANTLRWHAKQYVVHCSGANDLSCLQEAQEQAAIVGSFHPMQAFGDNPQTALATLAGCTIAVEAASPLDAILHKMAEQLHCHSLNLPPHARALYHASGNYAAQHIHVLLAEAAQFWASWGATERQALQALLPLLKGTIAALENGEIARNMPGPISRGDVQTVAKHLEAIDKLNTDSAQLYCRLANVATNLAQEAGKIDAATAQSLHQVLER